MALRVELHTERGEVVTKLADPAGGTFDAAGDFDRRLFDGDQVAEGRIPFTLLRYVDAYGDTIFNRVQIPTCFKTSNSRQRGRILHRSNVGA